jgi:hypothetical protein
MTNIPFILEFPYSHTASILTPASHVPFCAL